MTGIIYIPSANAADVLTGAVLDSDATTGTTSTGLTNGVAYRAFALSDPSTTFTPNAKTQTFIEGMWSSTVVSQAITFTPTLAGVSSGDVLIVAVSVRSASTVNLDQTMSLGANTGVKLAFSPVVSNQSKSAIFRVIHPGGTPNLVVSRVTGGTAISQADVAVWKVTGASEAAITSASFAVPAAGASPQSLDLNAASGDLVFAFGGGSGSPGQTMAISGMGSAVRTNDVASPNVFRSIYYGQAVASTGTPRTVSATWTGSSHASGVAITL